MKKLISWLLLLVLAFSLVACGDTPVDDSHNAINLDDEDVLSGTS